MQWKIIVISLILIIVQTFGKININNTINSTNKSEHTSEKSCDNSTSKCFGAQWKFPTEIVPNELNSSSNEHPDNTTMIYITETDGYYNDTITTDNKLYFKDSPTDYKSVQTSEISFDNSTSKNFDAQWKFPTEIVPNELNRSDVNSNEHPDNTTMVYTTKTDRYINDTNTTDKLYVKDSPTDYKSENNATNTTDGDTYDFRIYESRTGFLFQGPEIVSCPIGYSLSSSGICQKI